MPVNFKAKKLARNDTRLTDINRHIAALFENFKLMQNEDIISEVNIRFRKTISSTLRQIQSEYNRQRSEGLAAHISTIVADTTGH